MKVRLLYCNYEWVKRKFGRQMYAQFRSRQDLNLRGKIPTDFKSVALTTRPRLPGYKYFHYRIIFILVFQKKWAIERFRSTDVSICRTIIYSLEGFIFGKYRKNTRLKFLSQTTLWWARKVYSNTIRKFWACSARWKFMTLITFTTGRKQRLNRNFCVISNFRSRHDLNMRGKIPTDF